MDSSTSEGMRTIEQLNKEYSGKSALEILDLEKKMQEKIKDDVDAAHKKSIEEGRSKMLTVQKLIDYLKTQDSNACILAYEPNSFAFIEQLPDLPSRAICTIAEDKKNLESHLRNFYRDSLDVDAKVKQELELTYRYARDNDVVIQL